MDNTGRQNLQEGMAKHGGYIEFKKSLWGFRFSMYPAASNAHLKALRLNLVGLLAPRIYKVFRISGKNKRRPGHSAPMKGGGEILAVLQLCGLVILFCAYAARGWLFT